MSVFGSGVDLRVLELSPTSGSLLTGESASSSPAVSSLALTLSQRNKKSLKKNDDGFMLKLMKFEASNVCNLLCINFT